MFTRSKAASARRLKFFFACTLSTSKFRNVKFLSRNLSTSSITIEFQLPCTKSDKIYEEATQQVQNEVIFWIITSIFSTWALICSSTWVHDDQNSYFKKEKSTDSQKFLLIWSHFESFFSSPFTTLLFVEFRIVICILMNTLM